MEQETIVSKGAQVILDEIKSVGFSKLKSNLEHKDFLECNKLFQEFRKNLSSKAKKFIQERLRDVYGEIGFVEKNSEDDDTKYYFHYNIFLEALYQKRKDSFSEKDKQICEKFFSKMRELYGKVESSARDFLTQMDMLHHNFSGNFINSDDKMICFYRLLEYPYQNNDLSGRFDKPLANPHTDSGGFTLALYETCPGLEICKGENICTYTPIVHSENNMLLFPGRSFQNFYPGIPPSIHQVKKLKECYIDNGSRFAHVFFVWPLNEFKKEIWERL